MEDEFSKADLSLFAERGSPASITWVTYYLHISILLFSTSKIYLIPESSKNYLIIILEEKPDNN